MKPRALASVALLLAAACAASSAPFGGMEVRPADDTPPAFATEDGTIPVEACRSPLVDPRDQTRLRLIRSAPLGATHYGDYEVPVTGRYGVGRDELLRVNCETGQALGVVDAE